MAQITVLDSLGVSQTVAKVVNTGQTTGANALPVVNSTDDVMLGIVTETAPATDTASSGLNGRLQRIAQRLTSLIANTPAVGTAADAASSPVALSTEGKAQLGALTETAPATDTASSGLNGRLQRVAQRLTSLIALIPAALGTTAAASSLGVALSTEDVARVGIITETAPATDIASSGLNGRLQRVAQNLSTVNATLSATNTQLPTTPSGAVNVTITRPANVTAYTAGDVLGGALTIASGMTSGQRVMVAGVNLMPQIAAIPAGMTNFRLHVYSVTPPSALADNAVWDLPSGDRASYLGYVDVGTPVDVGSTLYVQTDAINKLFQMSGSASLFGYLVTNGGFTPAGNSEVYQLGVTLLGL